MTFFSKKMLIVCSFSLFVVVACLASPRHHWVCQDCDPYMQPNYQGIQKAIDNANPGDTVCIVAEEYPVGGAKIIEYYENLVIDKKLTLECKEIHPVFGQPVITIISSDSFKPIVDISGAAAGTVVSNIHIRGPQSDSTTYKDDPLNHIDENVGLRIAVPDCTIDNCKITHCMTGILVDRSPGAAPDIRDCTIGERWVGLINGFYCKEDSWTTHHKGYPIVHPGNGFGIVCKTTDSTQSPDQELLKKKNKISCNRYSDMTILP